MNKDNTYFNAMRETVEAHRRDSTKPFPYTQGACKAYRAWAASVSRGNEEPELDDFLWEREVSDFIATLRAAGIESFTSFSGDAREYIASIKALEEFGFLANSQNPELGAVRADDADIVRCLGFVG